MKTYLLIALMLCMLTTKATNYYFSQATGDDSRTPGQAQNPSTPWKTVSKLNAFFSTLKAGDSVLLKRGETFYGSIKINKSGAATAPIVIGAYGQGNKPVITSMITLSNWVSKGNGIWESNDQALTTSAKIVLLNGVGQQIGRYPNIDAANKGYLVFESHSGTSSITDNQFSSSTNWAGSELVVRTRRWLIDVHTVASNSGHTIYYNRASSYTPYNNYGYFFQNSVKTLDKLGEWYLNPSTKKLSVYFGSANPASYTIKIASLTNIISAYNCSYVALDNLNITGANHDGITIQKGTGMTIKNCDISYAGDDGIIAISHPKIKIENCTISNSNNNGIDLGYSSNQSIIRHNKISNISMIAGMGQNGDGKGIGIFSNSDGSTIEYNEISNAGYIGITYGGSDVLVKNNIVDKFCSIKDDGAGIYSHGSSNGAAILYYRRKVTGNIVMNGVGAGPGTDRPEYLCASGIYMDNDASATVITDNTFFNCSQYGVFIHNSRGMTITNNHFYNNTKQVSFIQDADNVAIRNNVITNNVFFSKHPEQLLTSLISSGNDIASFGKWDSNYYARPIDDRIAIFGQYVSGGDNVKQNFELEGWKEKYDEDKNSKRSAKQIAPYRITTLTGAGKVVNGDFTDAVTGVSANYCTFARSTSGMLDGGYLQVTPTSKSSYLNVKIGGLTAGKKYILRYTIRGSAANRIGVYFKEAVSPYNTITSSQYRGVSTTRKDNELLFTSPNSKTSAYVVFKADEQNKYYLDNIQVFEAEALMTNIDDSLRFEYNATTSLKSISLNGNYMDVKGNTYSNNLSLQPYKSVILIKITGGAQNSAPTVSITSPANNANFIAPASINIAASATDADGSVAKVEFYNGSTLLGTKNTSPYVFTWTNVVAGNYLLTAKATDNKGLSSSTEVSISVGNNNQAPTVSITSPANNASFNGPASISIAASATDNDGAVAKVEFYKGSTLLGTTNTSPYIFTWNNVAAGNYTLTAKAIDNKGLTSSSSVNIIVATPTTAPAITITSPANNAVFSSTQGFTFSALASDGNGSIKRVEFYRGTTLLEVEYYEPYSFTVNNLAPGTHTLTAKAIDNNGLATSTAVIVSVVTSNQAPTVAITSPAAIAFTAPASINITASANDADGSVVKVELYNGSILVGTQNSSPYNFTWKNVASGNYVLTAKAIDNKGLASYSGSVSISVTNPSANAGSAARAAIAVASVTTDFLTSLNGTEGSHLSGNDLSFISDGHNKSYKKNAETANIKIGPNPASNLLSVYTNGLQKNQELKISILSISGRLFKTFISNTSNDVIQVNLSSLNAGLYLVNVATKDFSMYKKFKKQ